MAKSTLNYQPRNYRYGAVNFLAGNGTGIQTVFNADADDSVICSLGITSTDANNKNVLFSIHSGASGYNLCSLDVPAGAGTNGATLPSNGLSGAYLPLDGTAKSVLPIPGSWSLRARLAGPITGAGVVSVIAIAKDF